LPSFHRPVFYNVDLLPYYSPGLALSLSLVSFFV
jgi:hypothetical protein